MAGFDDLVFEAQPYVCIWPVSATVGKDWKFQFATFVDYAGTSIAWTSGYTGLCKIKDTAAGTTVATPTVTFPAAGVVQIVVANATTETIAPGEYVYELEVTRTSDGAKASVVGAVSTFSVLNEVAD